MPLHCVTSIFWFDTFLHVSQWTWQYLLQFLWLACNKKSFCTYFRKKYLTHLHLLVGLPSLNLTKLFVAALQVNGIMAVSVMAKICFINIKFKPYCFVSINSLYTKIFYFNLKL